MLVCVCVFEESDRVEQSLSDILPVPVPQTRPAELTLNPAAALAAAAGLAVDSFLTTLMASGALGK